MGDLEQTFFVKSISIHVYTEQLYSAHQVLKPEYKRFKVQILRCDMPTFIHNRYISFKSAFKSVLYTGMRGQAISESCHTDLYIKSDSFPCFSKPRIHITKFPNPHSRQCLKFLTKHRPITPQLF